MIKWYFDFKFITPKRTIITNGGMIVQTLSIYHTSRWLIVWFLRRNHKVNFIRPNIFVLSILIGFLIFLSIQEVEIHINSHAQLVSENVTNDKIVILNFDDGRRTQFTHAKPILDKYGFKATFYIVCNYISHISFCKKKFFQGHGYHRGQLCGHGNQYFFKIL